MTTAQGSVGGHVGYVYDPVYLLHDWPGHPENPQRLQAIMHRLSEEGMLNRLTRVPARPAAEQQLARAHSPLYLAHLQRIAEQGGGHLDPDTYVTPDSWEAARWAAGGVNALAEAVIEGHVRSGFALIRPPGHHAGPDRGMGFCLVNNVAIAAQAAIAEGGLSRLLIVDFDVHHGNGTQDIFAEDERVCYFSTHLYPFYPGTGHWQERGHGSGEASVINVPLPARTGDDGYARILAEILIPVAQRFKPELILVSAGYDGHWRDPLAMMALSMDGFAAITRTLKQLADELCAGRLVLSLEGGYDLQVLAQGVLTTFAVLLGDDRPSDPFGHSPYQEPDIDRLLGAIKRLHGI